MHAKLASLSNMGGQSALFFGRSSIVLRVRVLRACLVDFEERVLYIAELDVAGEVVAVKYADFDDAAAAVEYYEADAHLELKEGWVFFVV